MERASKQPCASEGSSGPMQRQVDWQQNSGSIHMKKLISAAVLSLALAVPAFAQEAKPAIPAVPAPAVAAPAVAAPAPAPAAAAVPAAPAVAAPKPAAAVPAAPAAAVVPAKPAVPTAAAAVPAAASKAVEAVKSAVVPAKPAAPAVAAPAAAAPVKAAAPAAAAATAKKMVDINKATAAELDALPQIGAARTKAIIAGRPYKSVDDLKKVLPANAFDAVKGLVTTK
jgi:competence protein ComEA